MRSNLLIALTLAFSASAGLAFAEDKPDYSAADIVNFMATQKKVAERTLAARAVCIGSDDECDAAMEQPTGFDLVINFAKDSSELTDEAKAKLDVVASALKNPELNGQKFRVEGFTDALGSDQHNDRLSLDRANAVASYLVQSEVSGDRLAAEGFGKRNPRFTDPFDPENRRVELKLRFKD
jgi:outer membrane protein OmpA-like peptidoglycan-associated protein